MKQEEVEKEIKELKAENGRLAVMCKNLELQVSALQKRVRRIEADIYKDVPTPDEEAHS